MGGGAARGAMFFFNTKEHKNFEWFPMVPFENRKNSVARQSPPGRLLFRLKNNPENDTLTGKQKKPFYTFSL